MDAPVKRVLHLLALISVSVVMSACGLGGSTTLDIDGSSTVFPITEAVVEGVWQNYWRGRSSNRGHIRHRRGFQKFCNGETEISSASRPIKQIEVDRCLDKSIEFIEIPIAYDGLTVVVNPKNDFIQCLTVDELRTIWAPEAQEKIKRWSQVRDGLPDKSFLLFGPGVDSGTFDFSPK